MERISLNYNFVSDFLSEQEIFQRFDEAKEHLKSLINKTGKGNDFLGWIDYTESIQSDELYEIEEYAEKIREKIDILVLIGIGGSYLGTKAIIDMLSHSFTSLLPEKNNPIILFAGNNLGEDYLHDLLEILNYYEYGIVVVSKSGTTTEPAIAFRILKHHIENKYGKDKAKERIYVVTDKNKGILLEIAKNENYKCFYIPDDIGGRYSVLTPVGLLPLAIVGIDIHQLIQGANSLRSSVINNFTKDNIAIQYALIRNALYNKGKLVEIMVSYTPRMHFFIEWWKQLFGESEGKENKGLLPVGVDFTTDLHSLGQYIQEGKRILFETVLHINKPTNQLIIPHDNENIDKLNFLSYKRVSYVNNMAMLGTILAHTDAGVPNILIDIPSLQEKYIGQLIYFFQIACGISGYLLGVNPFDQPGVEAYKNNLFALINKPGYENISTAIKKRLNEKFKLP
ncbi:MAG: glucose-6-phosphate isomerase [Bacteroidales bacterium]|nr:glucose-6-phosphate isomerase [Bacteroidales bacterium]